jgi:protease-4
MPNAPQSPGDDAGWERRTLERLAFAVLEEQRAARRWRIFFRLAWLAVALLLAFGLLRPIKGGGESYGPHTALVDLHGEIAADAPASAERLNEALRNAFEDRESRAVVLRINSPGGSPVQAGLINETLTRLKAKHGKPVYAVVDEICASGGYYVAVAADRIYVDRASLIGSIGVLSDGFGFTGLMDKLGIERRLYTAGQDKGFLDPFSPQTERQRAHMQAMLAQIHAQFIGAVKQGRGARLKGTDAEVFSGLVFTGERGIELGLADARGDLDFVAREVVQAERIVDYTIKDNLFDRVARRVGASFGQAFGTAAARALVTGRPLLR